VNGLVFNVISPDAERFLVAVRGELWWPEAEHLWHRLDTLINRGVLVVLDLRNVEALDSSGIRTLLLAQRAAAQRGATLRLAGAGEPLIRLLARGGVDDLFDIRPDPGTALVDHDDDAAPRGGNTAAQYRNQADEQ